MALTLPRAVGAFEPTPPLAVAFSGGADSTALLVACARKWPGEVRAIHVHHGLQPAAGDFQSHCEKTCAALGVPLHTTFVDAKHAPGESPEGTARAVRYAALAGAARDNGIRSVALAQHADDQVETLLLALSRGAGLPGLAGMREQWESEGVVYHRPLLEVPGESLRDFLRGEGIAWIEDPTNVDERFTRNRIRAQLLPALAQAFPSYRETFGRSARHAARGARLLEEIAAEDLARIGVPPPIEPLRALSRPRRANVLRHWLRASHATQATEAQLEELLDQVEACATRGHSIRIKVGAGFVVRAGAGLAYTA